jgi:hypothetical protein
MREGLLSSTLSMLSDCMLPGVIQKHAACDGGWCAGEQLFGAARSAGMVLDASGMTTQEPRGHSIVVLGCRLRHSMVPCWHMHACMHAGWQIVLCSAVADIQRVVLVLVMACP